MYDPFYLATQRELYDLGGGFQISSPLAGARVECVDCGSYTPPWQRSPRCDRCRAERSREKARLRQRRWRERTGPRKVVRPPRPPLRPCADCGQPVRCNQAPRCQDCGRRRRRVTKSRWKRARRAQEMET